MFSWITFYNLHAVAELICTCILCLAFLSHSRHVNIDNICIFSHCLRISLSSSSNSRCRVVASFPLTYQLFLSILFLLLVLVSFPSVSLFHFLEISTPSVTLQSFTRSYLFCTYFFCFFPLCVSRPHFLSLNIFLPSFHSRPLHTNSSSSCLVFSIFLFSFLVFFYHIGCPCICDSFLNSSSTTAWLHRFISISVCWPLVRLVSYSLISLFSFAFNPPLSLHFPLNSFISPRLLQRCRLVGFLISSPTSSPTHSSSYLATHLLPYTGEDTYEMKRKKILRTGLLFFARLSITSSVISPPFLYWSG